MLKVTLIIALPVIVALAGVAYYSGMFDPLEMTREVCGPYTLIYREYRGPYPGVRLIINNVHRYVRDTLHLKANTAFAVFYDNPQSRDSDSLRSISGVITDSFCTLPPPYHTGIFKRTDAVVGHFRRRSFFSYTTGSYKFLTELSRIDAENTISRSGPVMEIYDHVRRSIRFIAPVGHAASSAPPFSGAGDGSLP
ncbi:MAG: hypothetical protein JW913_14335 [Chitinispirillaceae bacterium]|nr:hypothetical protein [Chitinispirillaceae bacterium]